MLGEDFSCIAINADATTVLHASLWSRAICPGDLTMFVNDSEGEVCAVRSQELMCCLPIERCAANLQQVSEGINRGFLDIKIKDKRQAAVIRLKDNDLIVISAKVHSIRCVFL